MAISEWWICPLILGMFLLPGWAILAFSSLWQHWQGLQRWIVALGLGIAFYPVLFYFARWLVPFLTFGPYKLLGLLAVCAGVIAWNLRHNWRTQFDFAPSEWIALGIVGTTLLTRFWILRDHPYPAWTDSLHHTLLTQLTALNGQLPTTLEPYAPIPLDQYHLGLYALTAALQWLARIPAHTALLWMAQFLNGICGVGVYLLLDRYAGRRAALIGAVVAGLLGQHPAFYFNWGRFTQVAAQSVLFIAWTVVLEALKNISTVNRLSTKLLAAAAFLSASVFLLHFRVAIFYALLIALGSLRLGWQTRKTCQLKLWLLALSILSILTMVLVSPVLWAAIISYFSRSAEVVATLQGVEREVTSAAYFAFDWKNLPYVLAPWWLIHGGLICTLGVLIRHDAALDQVLWAGSLTLLGLIYRLDIPWLSFTNLSGVLIMFYLPLSVIVGDTLGWLMEQPGWSHALYRKSIGLLVFLFCLNNAHIRTTELEPFRYFLSTEDIVAMNWIRENTPTDAIFAVNTYFWLPRAPHGADGGYWLPYFAERQTTTGLMLNHLGAPAYQEEVIQRSNLVKQLEFGDKTAVPALRAAGVTHLYLGVRGHFAGGGLSRTTLLQMETLEPVYDQGGVIIFAILPAAP